MAVNSLQPTVPYTITASNETADHSRQRQQESDVKNKAAFKSKPNIKTEKNIEDADEKKDSDPEATELNSQIIDSQKVIELLSHRPKYQRSVQNLFKKKKIMEEKSQFSDVKKINKSY